MKRGIVVSLVALALAGGCSKKKDRAGGDKGSAGSGEATGSGSAGGGMAGGSGDAPPQDAELVARGEYLANIVGCTSCHVTAGAQGPDHSKPFGGGLEIKERFGTWRPPNITVDKSSGIGSWTDEQIIAAIREGVRPDGSRLVPLMPYPSYNRMTDDDVKAIVAYLRSVPPVDNVVPPIKDLPFKGFPVPPPKNDPVAVDDPIKHGEYLTTIMHCSMCHMLQKDGKRDFTNPFAGGMEFDIESLGTGKIYGANLTSDPETGIGKWSEADIAKAIKTFVRPDGTLIQGPMQYFLAGWSKIEDKDLAAVAAYVKQIPPVKNKVPASTFKPHGPPR